MMNYMNPLAEDRCTFPTAVDAFLALHSGKEEDCDAVVNPVFRMKNKKVIDLAWRYYNPRTDEENLVCILKNFTEPTGKYSISQIECEIYFGGNGEIYKLEKDPSGNICVKLINFILSEVEAKMIVKDIHGEENTVAYLARPLVDKEGNRLPDMIFWYVVTQKEQVMLLTLFPALEDLSKRDDIFISPIDEIEIVTEKVLYFKDGTFYVNRGKDGLFVHQ